MRIVTRGQATWYVLLHPTNSDDGRDLLYDHPIADCIEPEMTTMAVFYIGSYDIVDMNAFQMYPPVVLSLLPKYGGEVLASDTAATVVEGTGRTMNAIIRFPSKEAALGLYNDPAYQEAKRVRQSSTKNVSMVLVEEFQMPTRG